MSPDDRWRALCAAARPDLPDPTDDDARAGMAELADRASRGATRQQRADLLADAPTILWEAFGGYDRGRLFAPWAVTVLRRKLITEQRRARRAAARDRLAPAGDAAVGGGEDVAAWFREAGAALAAAVFFPDRAGGHDFYALCWLDARLRAAEALRGPDTNVPNLSGAAAVFPWPVWVGPRRFTPAWPRLADLWGDLAGPDRYPAGGRRLDAVRAALGRLTPGTSFEDNTWHQWVSRAAALVRGRMEAEAWEKSFRHLFDYSPGPGTT